MKNLLLAIILFSLISCSNNKDILKRQTLTRYHASNNNGSWEKGEIDIKWSIGYYTNKSMKYFVGLVGFSDNDSVLSAEGRIETKIKDGFEYRYINNELKNIYKRANDTVYEYPLESIEFPKSYYIYKDDIIIEEYNYKTREKDNIEILYNSKDSIVVAGFRDTDGKKKYFYLELIQEYY